MLNHILVEVKRTIKEDNPMTYNYNDIIIKTIQLFIGIICILLQ